MRSRKVMALLALAVAQVVICLMTYSSAVDAAVTQTKSVISNGGTHSTSGTLTMTSNVGEVIVGHSVNGSQDIWHGFYAPQSVQLVGVDGPEVTFLTYLGTINPNPARGQLTVEFGNAVQQRVQIEVYDVSGRLVQQLANGPYAPGKWRISWDLRSNARTPVHAGLYFVRLQSRSFTGTQRLVVVP